MGREGRRLNQVWEPISRRALDAILADALAGYDEAVRRDWEAIRIEPQKWQCSPWGDKGGGFWAVAIRGDRVLWFNDIEDGFNWSEFSVRGTIGQYFCGQDEFSVILERFAQTRASEAWGNLSPGMVPPDLRGAGTITRTQTTYCELVADSGATYRVHFKDEEECALSCGSYPSAEVHTTHPLLADYDSAWACVYLADQADEPITVASAVASAIVELSGGWRTLADYDESVRARELLAGGHGLLLRAPAPVCAAAASVLEQHGLRCSTLAATPARGPRRVLVLGRGYVVASAFAFERRSDDALAR